MKISDIEAMDFNKIHLEFMHNCMKIFNQFEKFDGNKSEDLIFVESLKYENDYSSNKRNEFSNYVLEKDCNNKYLISYEKIKSDYSKICHESGEAFKNANENMLRNNLKEWTEEEWAEEECCHTRKCILMSLNKLKDVSLSYG